MRLKFIRIAFWFGFLLSISTGNAQVNYTNLEWVDRSPIIADSIYHSASIVVSGKLYVVANKVNGSGNTDIYTLKIDSNGDTLWSKTYNGSATGSMDYGIDLRASSDGYVYVIGAAENTSTGYDYCLIKYSQNTGAQTWVRNWNGTGNGDDIPSSLYVDGSSAIFVTGGSEATNGLSDYGTIKVSNLNVLNWTQYYNYNNLHDGATAITKNSTNVVVTGGSAASVGDWDIATVSYSILTGSAGTPSRTNVTGATMVQANGMTTDLLNNIYVTGYAVVSGERNIQTVKLDSNLALVWIKEYTAGTYSDEAKDVGVDNSGNVYVTGYNEIVNSGAHNMITIKYNSGGTQQWVKELGNVMGTEYATGERLAVTAAGDVYLTGTSTINNQSKMMFVKYNTSGGLKLMREYESDDVDYRAYDINLSGNNIYITGVEQTIDTTRMTVLKYEVVEKSLTPSTDTTDEPYIENAIIVRFFSDVVNTSIIDNKNITTGTLDEFVDSATIAQMTTKTGIDCDKLRTFKIFRGMTTADSLSITRLGDTIRIDPLWSTLLVYIDAADDEAEFIDSISTITSAISYAEKDYTAKQFSVPNDSYYNSYQKGLRPTITYPGADINVETAWDIEVGQPTTTVAVVDAIVTWSHEDFGDGTLSGSKIIDGYDLYNGNPLSASGPYGSHGTACAGIIGAIRNNSQGVAGIAGGDDALSNTGVEMYSLGVFGADDTPNSILAEAILQASIDNPTTGYGYGAHLQNHSWGSYLAPSIIIHDAVRVAWRNHSIFVASRGNDKGNIYAYPACFEDERVINVGGSGLNGGYKSESSGDPYNANQGGMIDVIAPAETALITSTIAPGQPYNYDFTSCLLGSNYQCFTGTSAAAPHVTGVSALIYSHHNVLNGLPNNLSTEDIEYLVENTAVDQSSPNYDSSTGWGLLNAGDALEMIESPYYYIIHASEDPSLIEYLGISTIAIYPDNDFDIPPGQYIGKQYKVSWSFALTLPTNHDILDAWLLEAATYKGVDDDIINPDGPWMNTSTSLIADNIMLISGYTYTWDLVTTSTLEPVNQWYPYSIDDIALTYSAYVQTNEVLSLEEDAAFDLQIYPNPANTDFIEVALTLETGSNVSYQIVNLLGETVFSSEGEQLEAGKSKFSVPLNNLSVGTYFCRVTVNDEIHIEKFVVM